MEPSTSSTPEPSASTSSSASSAPLAPARPAPADADLELDLASSPSGAMLRDTFSSSVLLATLPALDPPRFLVPAIATAARCTTARLSIVLYSRAFNARAADASRLALWDDVQRLLTFVYVAAARVAQETDRPLLDVDVLLQGLDGALPQSVAAGAQIVFRIQGDSIPALLPPTLAALRTCWCTNRNPESAAGTPHAERAGDAGEPRSYAVAALGGTFDHLHSGHKILLSMGAWIADERLVVGVTDEVLLQGKKHREFMEPINVRTDKVRDFLARFKPALHCDAVPIADVYGPTADDPSIEALIVSHETLAGAASIDRIRAERGLPALRTLVIDVISHSSARLDAADAEALKSAKMSSTAIREWIAGRLAKEHGGSLAVEISA